MTETAWTRICPVVRKVPARLAQLKGREQVAALSAEARRTLADSAALCGVALPERLEKDDGGAPRPAGRFHWSLSHKPAWTAAVVAPVPVGIDIETVRPFHPGLPKKVATAEEWRLSDTKIDLLLFRYWTAKEAVLKASGTGLRGLDHCRVVAAGHPQRTDLRFQGKAWTVFHLFFDGQVAAVTDAGLPLHWSGAEPAGRPS